jgi:hypothetical protein
VRGSWRGFRKSDKPESPSPPQNRDPFAADELDGVAGGILTQNENITTWALKPTTPRKLD